MKKFNIGIIGLGIGEKHFDAYQKHPNCNVRSICDFNNTKLEKYLKKYPTISVTDDAEQILQDPKIDIVSVASFDNYHFNQVMLSINRGKHVFVEKPLCLFKNEAREIRQALKQNNVRMSSNMVLRTCPRFIHLKGEIDKNLLGDIYYIEGDYFWGRPSKLTEGWRKELEFYSIIYGASIHLIDLINWLIGLKPIQVKGDANNLATRHSGFKFNDFSVILLEYPNGLVVKISSHGGCVHPHFHNLKIFGTEKTFENNLASAFRIEKGKGDYFSVIDKKEYPAKEKRENVILSFVDSILDPECRPIVSEEDIFSAMSICFSAEEAIDTNKSISIEYI